MTIPKELAWLASQDPASELRALRASGALAILLPEVDALYGVPQNPDHHPEVCTGAHIELCLEMAVQLGASPAARYAVLVHDLGKALTPGDELPKHIDHETRGLAPVAAVCDRFDVPVEWRKVALAVCEFHLDMHRAFEMRSQSVLRFLERTNLTESSAYSNDFFVACESDKRGRLGKQNRPYRQGEFMRLAVEQLVELPALPVESNQTREWQDRHNARLKTVRRIRAPFMPTKGQTPEAQHC